MKYASFTKPLTVHLEENVYETIRNDSEKKRQSMGEYVRNIFGNQLNLKTKKGGNENDDK